MDTCCRTCSRSDQFQSISVDAISENSGEPVYLMLIYCTQLQFTNREKFPQQICYDCMTRLDAAFAFWKQSRQADATLQQQQLVLGSGGEESVTITTTTTTSSSYPQEVQIQSQPDEFQAEECKFSAQTTQVIAIDEVLESESEVEAIMNEPPPPPAVSVEEEGLEDEALTHQRYIIDSEAESEAEEEQEPEQEQEPVRVARLPSRPTFKIKINHAKKSKPVTTGRLKCNHCKLTFPTSSHLRRHLKMHETTCQHCGKIFSTVNSRNRHQSLNCSVLKNTPYIAYCEHCNRGFSNSKSVIKHQKHVCPVLHPDGSVSINSATCKYCKRGFSSSQNMFRHQRQACPVLKRPSNQPLSSAHIPKQCPYCRKRFLCSKEIKRHVRHCARRRPATPAPALPLAEEGDIDSPNYEVHPSELLDCVIKHEDVGEVLGS